MDWLMRTPLAVVGAFIEMLPRLQAEESLERSTEAGVGSGTWKPANSRKQVNDWIRAASAGRRRRAVRATPGALASMGIGVVKRNG